jgi:hypothetical protein
VRPRAWRRGLRLGVLLGLSLGFVYAPCAGPILAGVITVSASQDFTAGRLAVALALQRRQRGRALRADARRRRLTAPSRAGAARFQQAMGVVLLVVAVVMATELDIRFENRIAADLPAILVNPSKDLEDASATRERARRPARRPRRHRRRGRHRSDRRQAPRGARPRTRYHRTRSAGGTRRATARSRSGRFAGGSF